MLRGLLNISRHTLKIIWVSFNVAMMTMLVVAAYCGYIDPRWFAFAQTINLSFPLWIVVAVMLLFVNLFVLKRLSLAWFVMMALCAVPIYTISPVNFGVTPDVDSTTVFKLMTYNVYSLKDIEHPLERDTNRTIQYMLDMNPDIICLQESSAFFLSPNGKFKGQRKEILSRYPYRTQREFNGEYVLSRFPIKNITPEQPDWGSGSYRAYEVDIEGHKLVVIDVHFQSIDLSDNERERYRSLATDMRESPRDELSFVKHKLFSKLNRAFLFHAEQADHVINFVNSLDPGVSRNLIIAGDFNDVPGSYLYRSLCNRLGLNDAYTENAFGPTITYYKNRFYFRIDQILYRGDMAAIDIVRGNLRSSDHYPLTATFMWKPE